MYVSTYETYHEFESSAIYPRGRDSRGIHITNDIGHLHRTMSRLQCLDLKSVFRQIVAVRPQARVTAVVRHRSKLSNWGTKKPSSGHVKLVYFPEGMADPKVEQILAPLRAAVKKQVSGYRPTGRTYQILINKITVKPNFF